MSLLNWHDFEKSTEGSLMTDKKAPKISADTITTAPETKKSVGVTGLEKLEYI